MCYSARIVHDYRRYLRSYGAELSLDEFVDLFWRRVGDPKLKVPKAMELALLEATGEVGSAESGRALREHIATYAAAEAARLGQELFAQKKRLADAERKLSVATTRPHGRAGGSRATGSRGPSSGWRICVERPSRNATIGSSRASTRR